MNKYQTSIILIILGYWLLLMESSIFSFPFVFVFSIAVLAIFRNLKASIFALILGLFSDSFRVINFGLTPMYIFSTYLAILFYEKYFGKNDIIAIISIIVLSTLIYAYYMNFSFFNIFLAVFTLLILWVSSIIFNYSFKS